MLTSELLHRPAVSASCGCKLRSGSDPTAPVACARYLQRSGPGFKMAFALEQSTRASLRESTRAVTAVAPNRARQTAAKHASPRHTRPGGFQSLAPPEQRRAIITNYVDSVEAPVQQTQDVVALPLQYYQVCARAPASMHLLLRQPNKCDSFFAVAVPPRSCWD